MQNQVVAFLDKHDLSSLANIVPLPYFGRNHNLTFGCNGGFNRHILHITPCKTKYKRITFQKKKEQIRNVFLSRRIGISAFFLLTATSGRRSLR